MRGAAAARRRSPDGKLTLTKLQTPPGDDGLSWTGTLAPVSGATPDPLTSGVRVVVTDASAAALMDVTVPGGAYDKSLKTGWKVKKTTWTWQGNLDGLTKVKLVAKTPGMLKMTVAAKGVSLPSAPATAARRPPDRRRRERSVRRDRLRRRELRRPGEQGKGHLQMTTMYRVRFVVLLGMTAVWWTPASERC